MTQIALAIFVMFVAAAVQGSIGFGQNLLAAPVLLQIDPQLVPSPIIVAAFATNFLLFVRERQHVDLGLAVPAIIGRIPGAMVGAAVVAVVSTRALSIVVACIVLGVVAMSLAGLKGRPSRQLLFAAGAVAGFSGTTSSIGGPPVGIAMQHESGPVLRSSMGAYFVVGSIFSMLFLSIGGELGSDDAVLGLFLLPGVLTGFFSSRWFVPFVDRGRTRGAVLSLATIAALLLLVRVLLG